MRLIDADELNRVNEESIAEYGADYYTGEMIYGMRMVCQYAVEQAPTVDAVPVIRCKECIHFKYDADCFGDCMLDGGIVRTIYSNDFCSWAVRSEDETS